MPSAKERLKIRLCVLLSTGNALPIDQNGYLTVKPDQEHRNEPAVKVSMSNVNLVMGDWLCELLVLLKPALASQCDSPILMCSNASSRAVCTLLPCNISCSLRR